MSRGRFQGRGLDRRTVLKGLLGGAMLGVGVPILEAMLNGHGSAYADGDPLPTRFGLWFFGNGVRLSSWLPVNQGADWQPPAAGELVPLVPHKEYVSVISGLNVKTPRHPHHSGISAVCSGGPHLKVDDVRDTIVSTFKYKSIDQVAADHFQALAPSPYRSLEAAITRFRGTDEGTSFQYLSHNGSANGETNVNPSEESPQAFFERLFNMGTAAPLLLKARASVLDSVANQITALEKRLGHRDKERLDQHFTSVRELEQRLSLPLAECSKPTAPGDFPDVKGNEQMVEKNKVMSDLMVLALTCRLTQSFSIMFSTCGSGVVMWPAGATDGQHYMNHTEPAPRTKQHNSVTFTMGQLAYFLEKLKGTPEGAGNLLDQSSIFVCTEHAEGWTHSQDDMPMLLCGKGGGRLKGNVHYRGNGDNASRGLLTALRGAGLPLSEFGHEAGKTSTPIAELENA